jgi:hypothetical protein
LTLSGRKRPVDEAEFVFFAHRTGDLDDAERRFTMSPDDLALINPNTKTAPVFRSRRDAEITAKIYRNVPVLVREGDPDGNPWGIEFSTMFHMTSDSHLFRTADELRAEGAELHSNIWIKGDQKWFPLYEAKMAHQYNHRDGDYGKYSLTVGKEVRTLEGGSDEELADALYVVQPRYWVARPSIERASKHPEANWLLGFRDITNTTTNRRTFVSFALPMGAVGHKSPLIWSTGSRALLMPLLNSFALDFISRQKIGGSNMTFFVVKQLAVLSPGEFAAASPWSSVPVHDWMTRRVLELTYTAWDHIGFGADLGYFGPPFRWDPGRRELLRAELDAAFFHLYGLHRDDVDYIMDTFEIVRRKDEAVHGEYRTKRLILERYDAMAGAEASGTEYQSILDPPPADPSIAHDPSTRPGWADWYLNGADT